MGFYGRFAAAYGTVWFVLTVLALLGSSAYLGQGGVIALMAGCAGWAAISKRGAKPLSSAPPPAELPAAVVVRNDPPQA